MLGISLYPDKTTFEQDKEYLDLAKQLGYQRVFTSFLQIDIHNPKKSVARIKESCKYAKEIGMHITLDIHPMVFDFLKIKNQDLGYFHEFGVSCVRLDSSFNGRIEAEMTRNPYGIEIELNMSNDTQYLDLIHSYHPRHNMLRGSHNFYPQKYTGLSLPSFEACSRMFQKYHIPSAAFITSQEAKVSPWPVCEGNCTLEMHRHLPLKLQAQHLLGLDLIDDWIIGNAFASREELIQVKNVYEQRIATLHVELKEDVTEFEKELLFSSVHDYRGDHSDYVIRSVKNRTKYSSIAYPSKGKVTAIKRGDVLLLNEDYGQYKGELQIALCDREGDVRIHVVGSICKEELILLDQMHPFQQFELKEKL